MPSVHSHTPQLAVIDNRSLPVRDVAYWRQEIELSPLARVTGQQHDTSGRLVAQRDPRFLASTSRPNLATVYSLSGVVLFTDSIDAGWRLGLPGDDGQTQEHWDGRGNHWKSDYDKQRRPTAIHERTRDADRQTIERLTYADNTGQFAARNQCGRLIRHDDTAGTLHLHEYGLRGTPIIQNRHFLDSLQRPDWPSSYDARNELLEPGEGFQTVWRHGPGGELHDQIDARGHRQSWQFDKAGQLQRLHLQLKGQPTGQTILHSLSYNAAGQIESQTAGNGAITSSQFDPANSRLQRRVTDRIGRGRLQELSYQYDPGGNVVRVQDHTQPTRHFANQRVEAISLYTYDSLSQLTSATGREALGQSIRPELPDLAPNPGDSSRLLNYTEHYEYDRGGNLILLRHESGHPGQVHRRAFMVAEDSNRALPWDEQQPPDFARGFDANGNLQGLHPQGRHMLWTGQNQLQQITQVYRQDDESDAEYYRYDHQGLRVRKQHRSLASLASRVTHVRDVRYLPGLEIRTRDDSEHLEVITVGQVRCLHWVTPTPDDMKQDQCRYSLDDLLGSSMLELDEHADVISHEGYYPYGGTAWWAARNAVEASYKTIRYSGKERDASGLYYYGFRYYAPWLCRWICPDPAGDIDGLNLYKMVGGNPIGYRDSQGQNKTPINKDIILVWAGENPEKLKTHIPNINNTAAQADGYKVHLYLDTYAEDAYSEIAKDLKVHDIIPLQGSDLFNKFYSTPAAKIYNDFRGFDARNLAFAVDVSRIYLVNEVGGIYSDIDDEYHSEDTHEYSRLGDTQLEAGPNQILTLEPVLPPWATALQFNNSSFAAHANNAILSATLDEMVVRYDSAVNSMGRLDPLGLGYMSLHDRRIDRVPLLTSMVGPGVLTDVITQNDSEMNSLLTHYNDVQAGRTMTTGLEVIEQIKSRMPLSKFIRIGELGSWS
jgi:insecticidal toxin complex protein TccC